MRKKILPPVYFLVLLILSILFHFLLPLATIISWPYRYLGILLILGGFGVVIWGKNIFNKHNTTIKPFENPSMLITSGLYHLSRNPIYVGMTVILVGVSVLLGSPVTFVFPVLFFWFMDRKFIPFEEENLEKAFGEEYRRFKKKVRRWL